MGLGSTEHISPEGDTGAHPGGGSSGGHYPAGELANNWRSHVACSLIIQRQLFKAETFRLPSISKI
eukprot:scaffold537796_cov35-Prasinocladus_malaysianus.AAC.1